MSKADILEKLKQAIIELDEEKVKGLLGEGLKAGLSPLKMISEGLSPGLTLIGDGYEKGEKFMSDLVIAGEIMNDALQMLRPEIEKGGLATTADTMVIGTIEGDEHNIGKRIVAAMFTGAGYNVVDIGENMPASEFVKAAKKYKAVVVGASAILGTLKPYCKVIDDALVDAGIRDDVIYIIGGWGMNEEWRDNVGADAFGADGPDAVHKVKGIRAGELPKFKKRAAK